MLLVIVAFCVVFLLAASGMLLLFYREALPQRIAEAINPRPKKRNVITTIRETGFSIGGAVEHFEHLLPKSQAEISIVLQRLTRAGYRNESAVKIFYGCKVLVPLTLCAVCLATDLASLSPKIRTALMSNPPSRKAWSQGVGLGWPVSAPSGRGAASRNRPASSCTCR